MRHHQAHAAGGAGAAGMYPLPAEHPGPVPPWLQHSWSYRDDIAESVPPWIRHPSPSVLDPAVSYDPTSLQAGPDVDLIGTLRGRDVSGP